MGTSLELVQIDIGRPVRQPKPSWLRAKAPVGENFHNLKKLARGLGLHTVCESAQCPNIGECWNHRTATFMLLGDICTRRCGFCAVPKGRPQPLDLDEPRRVAEAVATLGLKHTVITSVNRDVESVSRLYRAVRSGARYERTLRLLDNAKKFSPGMVTKSGLMVGLGETMTELVDVFRDLAARQVDILTVGQYLRPSRDHLPIARFYTPEEFHYLKEEALRLGFRHVESGPLVRSSYHAHEQADGVSSRNR